jgi:hypothetical protein
MAPSDNVARVIANADHGEMIDCDASRIPIALLIVFDSGWSWGCVSAIDSNGRTIWIADAHRDNGKRFVAQADEKLTAFLELESQASKEAQSI